MRDEDIARYEREMQAAKTDAEIVEVTRRWTPVLAKCFRSTSIRIKELNNKFDDLKESVSDAQIELLKATAAISERITELHKKPSFKESKIEWVLGNIERILLTLIVIVLIFGRDFVARLIDK
jgi:uncharacterized protein YfbU (UPF0304 family)